MYSIKKTNLQLDEKKDILVSLRTGFGKRLLCYALLPLVYDVIRFKAQKSTLGRTITSAVAKIIILL